MQKQKERKKEKKLLFIFLILPNKKGINRTSNKRIIWKMNANLITVINALLFFRQVAV